MVYKESDVTLFYFSTMGQQKSKEVSLLVAIPAEEKRLYIRDDIVDELDDYKYTYKEIILIVRSSYSEEEMLEAKNELLSACLLMPRIPVRVRILGDGPAVHIGLLQLESLKRKVIK